MDVYNYVLEFSKEVIQKFDGLIRVVALFGSRVKGTEKEESDIDVLIVVDDVYNRWDELVKSYYFTELRKILEKYKKIHASTITLSVFWEMARVGDPLLINILRVGIPIIDTFGLFETMKRLLQTGKIRPSEEAIYTIKNRIPWHIQQFNYHILKALECVYWIFVDTAHYVLMKLGYLPPSPEEIPKYLEELVKNKKLDQKYVKWYKAIYELVHKIAHGEIRRVSADIVEEWFQRALDFKNALEKIVK